MQVFKNEVKAKDQKLRGTAPHVHRFDDANRYALCTTFTPCLWRSRSRWMTRTPPNPSASTAAVLLQLHDRDFLSSSFAKERLSNSFAFDSFVRNQASVRESKKKKKKKTQVDFSRGVRSQPSNYAVYAPVTGNFRNFLVLVGFLLASFDRGLLQWCVLVKQSVEVDCEDHVVPPVKFLEPYDSNQSAASLTLHEHGERRHAVHVQLTSGTSSSNREEERPPEPITGFGSRAGTTTCDASGFGWLRSPISINQESEDNIELLPQYHVPCVTLSTLSLSCQTTLTKRKKKKKKKKDCQMSVYHKADPGELIQ